jgi:autophagy-related protein 16
MSTALALPANQQWKAVVFNQIKERNQIQGNGFKEVIRLYHVAQRKEKEFRDRASALEKEVMTLRQENSSLKKPSGAGGDHHLSRTISSPELDAKVQKLQEELTVSYKRNSDNASRMVEIQREMKEVKEENDKLATEAAQARQLMEEALQEQKRLKDKMDDDAKTFQLLQEELHSLRKTFEIINTENTKLKNENGELVERWMRLKSEEAEKMNTANTFYEQMVQQKTRAELANIAHQHAAPAPLPGAPVVVKTAFFDQASFVDCNAILPSKPKRKLGAHSAEVTCVTFSRSGMIMATGSTDKTVKLWDAPSGQNKTALAGPTQSVMCIQFSPSDDALLGASNDNACRIWGVDTFRLRHTLTGHVGKVFSATFAESQKVITGSHDRTIKLWDLTKGYCTRTIFCFSSLNDLCLAPDGTLLVSGHIDHHLRFWDSKNGDVVHDMEGLHDNSITSVTLSTDGTKVLTNSRDNTLKLVDIRTHEVIVTMKNENYRNGLSWTRACLSPDGRYAAAGSMDGTLVVWNTLNGKTEKTISKAHESAISACAWNPLGAQFASAGEKDKTVILWD